MKKATLSSTALWACAAGLMIGYQFAGKTWPALNSRSMSNLATLVGVGIVAGSMALMDDAKPADLFPSRTNTQLRNILNVSNFIMAVAAAASFGYLAGLFGAVHLNSSMFLVAVILLLLGIAFQASFAAATRRPKSNE